MEKQAAKVQDFCKQILMRDSGQSSHDQNVGRNMTSTCQSDEVSLGNMYYYWEAG